MTVNSVHFDNPQGYTIVGSGPIHLAENSDQAAPQIVLTDGHHQLDAEVSLLYDTALELAADTILTFNDRLDLNGHQLTLTGVGGTGFNGPLHTGGGLVDVQQGFIFGAGSVVGDVVNHGGTFSPGEPHSLNNSFFVNVPAPASPVWFVFGAVALLGNWRRRLLSHA